MALASGRFKVVVRYNEISLKRSELVGEKYVGETPNGIPFEWSDFTPKSIVDSLLSGEAEFAWDNGNLIVTSDTDSYPYESAVTSILYGGSSDEEELEDFGGDFPSEECPFLERLGYSRCIDCGCWTDNPSYYNDEPICEECCDSYYCWDDIADELILIDDSVRLYSGEITHHERAGCCDECGEWFLLDELHGGLCEDCMEEVGDVVYGYHEFSNWEFLGNPEDGIYLGCELELAGSQTKGMAYAGELLEDMPAWHAERDCTCAVELVSMPCAPSYLLNDAGLEEICSRARQFGFKEGYSGFHVHVSNKFTSLQIGSIIRYIEENFDGLGNYGRRRSSDEMLRWAKNWNLSSKQLESNLLAYSVASDEGRYHALNLCPTKTIEFRFFNGGINSKVLKSYIQLVVVLKELALEINEDWEKISHKRVLTRAKELGYTELLSRYHRVMSNVPYSEYTESLEHESKELVKAMV